MTDRKLIISTGDASDADGFLAIALYARTGADLLFIMNLPATYDPKRVDGLSKTKINFRKKLDEPNISTTSKNVCCPYKK